MGLAFRPRPFYTELEFVGSLRCDDQIVQDLQICIELPRHKPDRIVARILGNQITSRNLKKLDRPFGVALSLESTAGFHSQKTVRSSTAFLKNISGRGYSKEHEHVPSFIVAELELEDIFVEWKLPEPNTSQQGAVFYLTGPLGGYMGFGLSNPDCNGNTTVDWTPTVFDVRKDTFVNLELRPIWMDDTDAQSDQPNEYGASEDRTQLRRRIPVLRGIAEAGIDDLDTLQYRDAITGIADDICLLLGLTARRRINWFHLTTTGSRTLTEYTRWVSPGGIEQFNRRELAIPYGGIDEFVKLGFPALESLRRRGMDLSSPIRTFQEAHETREIEIRFFLLYLALDKVQQMYFRKRKDMCTVPNRAKRQALRSQIRSLIAQELEDDDAERVLSKLSELSRRRSRDMIATLCEELQIQPTEICQKSNSDGLPFISTRNHLFHGELDLDGETLLHDTLILAEVTQEVVLRLLGHRGNPRCPIHN